jgi:hypothetical protein
MACVLWPALADLRLPPTLVGGTSALQFFFSILRQPALAGLLDSASASELPLLQRTSIE